MEKIVLKFGGSSVANNEKLHIVAKKIIKQKEECKNIVVILSAQGKTTDRLISEAKELSKDTNKRELDMLISTGEQMSAAKLAMVLDSLGEKAISLTGWQAGIYTNQNNQKADIINIDTARIEQELKDGKIVIITGFQGINDKLDITTLGRGGSDTTAVAISAALKAKKCYIFSDVEGVFTADPNKVDYASKQDILSYTEMKELSKEGAKVLHNKCVEIGEKFTVPIITKSTFNENVGTVISTNTNTDIKSMIKSNISRISVIGTGILRDKKTLIKILDLLEEENQDVLDMYVSEYRITINLSSDISDSVLNKMHYLLFGKSK